ncbi:HWE histidine kinase domain-containing protein [Salipiger bermudensis]|uniref:HWE histidine kinase domain-containing protein n=1 Tax=Salipiger bermudensis TaxID=344736 RepID=UPI0030080E58
MLILAPLGNDANALAECVESSGLQACCLSGAAQLAERLAAPDEPEPLIVVLSHEAAGTDVGGILADAMNTEPEWSRLPILILASVADRPPPACALLDRDIESASYVLLERPAPAAVLIRLLGTLAGTRKRQFRTRDLLRRLEEEEKRTTFLLGELRHRVRNSLSVLQTLFKMTARTSQSVEELTDAFGERLRTLSDAHIRLANEAGGDSALATLVKDHIAPYAPEGEQVAIHGPAVRLTESVAFDLALVIHELATNAAKYGALSVPDGQVEVRWSLDDDSDALDLSWRESGGPPVQAPTRRGLGTTLISSFSAGEGSAPGLTYAADGLAWQAKLPKDCFALTGVANTPEHDRRPYQG